MAEDSDDAGSPTAPDAACPEPAPRSLRVQVIDDGDPHVEWLLADVQIWPDGEHGDVQWSVHDDDRLPDVYRALSSALQRLGGFASVIHAALAATADTLAAGEPTGQDVAFLGAMADAAERRAAENAKSAADSMSAVGNPISTAAAPSNVRPGGAAARPAADSDSGDTIDGSAP